MRKVFEILYSTLSIPISDADNSLGFIHICGFNCDCASLAGLRRFNITVSELRYPIALRCANQYTCKPQRRMAP